MNKTTITSSLIAVTLLCAASAQARSSRVEKSKAVAKVSQSRGSKPSARHRPAVVATRRTEKRVVVARAPAKRAVVQPKRVVVRHAVVPPRIALSVSPASPVRVRVVAQNGFYRMDRNHDGRISWLEARRAGRSWRAFRLADRNRDGLLTRYEARRL